MHLCAERENSFEEMLLHHVATCALYFGFVISNWIGIGAIIAWIHDVSDILAALTKLTSSTHYEKTTVAVFLSNILVWIITRLIWFPYFVVNMYMRPELLKYPAHLSHFDFFVHLNRIYLTALLTLHIYWFYVFMLHLLHYKTHGKPEDF